MDLHLFFEGKLGREEVASAYLATLLQYRADIRDGFFDMLADSLGLEAADSLKRQDKESWSVHVEKDQVDVRIENSRWAILVENKLQAGAKQARQLLRYYKYHIENNPEQRVIATYLAPGASLGKSEVSLVECSECFREQDFAVRLSWDTVADYLGAISTSDKDSWFIASGNTSIKKAIDDGAITKFPNEGGREHIQQVAATVRNRLQTKCNVKIGTPWPSKNAFTLATHGTAITLWLVLAFEADSTPPYAPTERFTESHVALTVRTMVKLSGAARRKPQLKTRWHRIVSERTVVITNAGMHKLEENGWLVLQQHVSGSRNRVVNEVAKLGESILSWIADFDPRGIGASA